MTARLASQTLEFPNVPLPASYRQIVVVREFNAPRKLVFTAWTEPEHMAQWLGCHRSTLVACKVDFRVRGTYKFIIRASDGTEHTHAGVYREISPPDRLVYTENYFGPAYQSDEALVTATFVDRFERTELTLTILHKSAEDRDRHLGSGFESGMAQTLDRFAKHLRTMSPRRGSPTKSQPISALSRM
jgi:uncharacterized protein YndB with AHSA1/START domain